MSRINLFNDRLFVILHDVLLIPLAWFGAYWLRFNLESIPEWAWAQVSHIAPYTICAQTLSYFITGSYRSMWGFSSLHDLVKILKSILLGCALLIFVLYVTKNLQYIPRSIIPLYVILLTALLTGSRFTIRAMKDYRNKHHRHHKKRVLIIGAGSAGEGLVRDMLRTPKHNYRPVAFVDDRGSKLGQEIHGIRVIGPCKNIPNIIAKYKIELIIIAIPSASSTKIRQIMSICEKTQLPVHTLPGLQHIIAGQVSVNLLREISLEDLLGRDPVSLDWSSINTAIKNHVILVSGAGGSIGSEVCRQVARLTPKSLIAIDHSEINLFNIEQELLEHFPKLVFHRHLIDIRDKTAIETIMQQHKPDIIFHAAAYKHVPMLQHQIREAVSNNILGTRILAEASIEANVNKFILVSTDKAVNPENIMGATKHAAELICQGLNEQNKTLFITVRFGNVLGSAGSVVPLFKKQIANGGPITVTHPDITRYFMTIPEASQLILQAMSIGNGGEIFVLNMGEPIKISSLAEHMIRLAGKIPEEDIEIQYTRLRPGEKMYEELFHKTEKLEPTPHNKILRALSRKNKWSELSLILEDIASACDSYNEQLLHDLLGKLVPDF